MTSELNFETLVSLCKRRGFVFPSSEIYGGIGGFWDYGPLGVEMKNNIKRAWWTSMVQERDDVVGIDASIIMNPRVWEASGHIEQFTDPMVDCKNCRHRFRADHILTRVLYTPDRLQSWVISADGSQADAHEQLNKRDWELRNQLKLPGLLAEDTSPFIDFSAKELVECPNCRE
ncbi:MAG TPA: glycine--tRNA ligase, partial [Dehalococcoidia bacterium]|nr:glycine--tRNA ligase [Dehalococcoidia bacterium]